MRAVGLQFLATFLFFLFFIFFFHSSGEREYILGEGGIVVSNTVLLVNFLLFL